MTTGEAQLTALKSEVDELHALRDSLVEKAQLLATLEAATSTDQESDSTLIALRASIERMQDVIDIRLEMLDEDMEYERSLLWPNKRLLLLLCESETRFLF